ncbi:hypothetical protein [Sphingobacterium hungaricum]
MLSTIFFLFFFGFFLWYNSSKKARWKTKSNFLTALEKDEKRSKAYVAIIFLIATALCIFQLGWMSGIMAAICAIMAMGSLIVLVFPFNYIRLPQLIGLYVVCLILEFTI